MPDMFNEIAIWHGDRNEVNSFVDFYGKFPFSGNGKVILKLTLDGAFSFTVNGRLAGFGESTDFPFCKEYHTFDITEYCALNNEIVLTVWHYGDHSQTYINAPAFLAFLIEENGVAALRSGKDILARKNPYFADDFKRKITHQLGFSYCYDLSAEQTPFTAAKEYGVVTACDRKISDLKLFKRRPLKRSATDGGFIFDLGKETVGFLDIDVLSEKKQKITISYGEHLRGGHVPRMIGDRDFSVDIVLKEGENKVLVPFRRLAGRYLEVDLEKNDGVSVRYMGIRPVGYPVLKRRRDFSSALDKKIYDVSVYTLQCCMHEHYEDCPWREQALYTMDSRNQMLCGYEAFLGTAFQRHSLILIAKSLRKDGLLSICAPSGSDIPIPFFSLIYPVQVAEYLKRTGDRSIVRKTAGVLHAIMRTFRDKICDNGLIATFPYPYWNFYEWSDGNDKVGELSRKKTDPYEKRYDLILNCAYVYAAKYYDEIFGTHTETEGVKEAIKTTFYDKERGLFRSDDRTACFSQLGNSLAMLIGLGDGRLAEKTANCDDMTPITLSMTTFLYDALLAVNEKKYSPVILSDIRRRYKKMLDEGATTFWETEKGADDFDGAGSLCHGWSAMPIHYYVRLNVK